MKNSKKLSVGVREGNSLVQASEAIIGLWPNKDPEGSYVPNCWTMSVSRNGASKPENQQIRKGVSHEASWALGICPVQWTFRDLRTESKAFLIIARAAYLRVSWWLSACGLALQAGLLWAVLLSLSRGVDALLGTFQLGLQITVPGISQRCLDLEVGASPIWWCIYIYFLFISYLFVACPYAVTPGLQIAVAWIWR